MDGCMNEWNLISKQTKEEKKGENLMRIIIIIIIIIHDWLMISFLQMPQAEEEKKTIIFCKYLNTCFSQMNLMKRENESSAKLIENYSKNINQSNEVKEKSG